MVRALDVQEVGAAHRPTGPPIDRREADLAAVTRGGGPRLHMTPHLLRRLDGIGEPAEGVGAQTSPAESFQVVEPEWLQADEMALQDDRLDDHRGGSSHPVATALPGSISAMACWMP